MEPRFRLQQLQWQTNMADCRAVKINIDIRIGDSDNCVQHFAHISENEQARNGGWWAVVGKMQKFMLTFLKKADFLH